jgi:hypothetical protein
VITKKGEAVVARRISGPRLSSSSRLSSSAKEVATREKEVVVYQRRSTEKTEPTAERNKLHRLAREMDATAGLEQLVHSMVYVLANRHVMSELPNLVHTKHPLYMALVNLKMQDTLVPYGLIANVCLKTRNQ